MKTIYQVAISNYDGGAVYGSMEDEALAQDLCAEVNLFLKTQNIQEEASVAKIFVFDKDDTVFKYSAHLSVVDKNDIRTEMIVPTYHAANPWMTIENIKSQLSEGYGFRYICKYGATKEEAINAAIDFYNQLEKEGMIETLIKLVAEHDKKYSGNA
jgi:glutamate formiminotransferase